MMTEEKTKTRISAVTGKEVTDYIDNNVFTQQLHDYATRQKEREIKGLSREKVPDEIGKGIIQIVNGLASRYNFRSYTYLDEMVGDALVACVNAVHKFNIEKSTNGFGFIGFCAWRVMVNRIKLEKHQQAIKESMLIDPSFEFFDMMENDDTSGMNREGSIDIYYQGKL